MKKILIVFLVASAILYLGGSLMEASFSIPKWTIETRRGVAVSWMLGSALIGYCYLVISHKNRVC